MGGLTTSNQVETKIQYTPTKCTEKSRTVNFLQCLEILISF